MERRRVLFVGFVVCFLALATLQASSTAPTGTISVGDFAVLVASKMTVNPGDVQGPLTPAVAVDILRKHGLKVDSDLASPLSEKQASDLFGQLGIALQTERPEALLTPERAASLVGIFGGNLASKGTAIDASPASKTSASTTAAPTVEELTPYDCQTLWPLPDCKTQVECNPCMYCCNKLLALNGTVCGHLCQKKNLVVSPEEPTP